MTWQGFCICYNLFFSQPRTLKRPTRQVIRRKNGSYPWMRSQRITLFPLQNSFSFVRFKMCIYFHIDERCCRPGSLEQRERVNHSLLPACLKNGVNIPLQQYPCNIYFTYEKAKTTTSLEIKNLASLGWETGWWCKVFKKASWWRQIVVLRIIHIYVHSHPPIPPHPILAGFWKKQTPAELLYQRNSFAHPKGDVCFA